MESSHRHYNLFAAADWKHHDTVIFIFLSWHYSTLPAERHVSQPF